MFDLRTLVLVSTVTAGIFSLTTVLVAILVPQERSLRAWTLGAFLIATGTLLISVRGTIPEFISVVIANPIVVLGYGFLYVGTRQLLGLTRGRPWHWIAAVITLPLFYFYLYAAPSVGARITISNASVVPFLAASAWLFWRTESAFSRIIDRLTSIVLFIAALLTGTRAILAPFANIATDYFNTTSSLVLNLAPFYRLLMFVWLAIMLALKVSGRLQNELRQRLVALQEASQALHESEDRYSAMFTNAKAIMLLIDPESARIVEANPAAQRFYGYDHVRMLQMKITDINVLRPEEIQAEMRLAKEEKRDYFLFSHRLASGEIRDVEVHSGPFQFQGKRVLYSIVHDITERRRDQQRIDILLTEQKAMLENDLIGIVRVRDRTIVWANPAFEDMLGWAPGELAGTPTQRNYPNEEAYRAFGAACYPVLSAGGIFRSQIEHVRRDGAHIWVEVNGSMLDQNSGESLWAFLDVTDRKRGEKELIAARELAEAANRAKSEFLANMSHEIRTPLNGLIGNAQLLEMTTLDQEQKEYLSAMMVSGGSLLSLINDILDLSKIEAEMVVLEKTDFSLRGCFNDVVRTQRSRIANKGLSLKLQIRNDVPDALIGDELRVKQILLNLLGNAIKFTKEGSIILGAAVKEHDSSKALIELAVTDTGIGIPKAVADDIFKPFVQADSSTTRQYGGSGLGLAISRRLAELMGGSISVQSTVGVGSTFRVLLPFTFIHQVGQEQGAPGPEAPMALWTGAPLKVLLAEDNAINWQFGMALLKKMGHAVTLAENGMDAMAALEAAAFDLVLMDIQMPVMDGQEALAMLRERERSTGAHLPVIALTAHALKGEEAKFLAAGFDGYVSKPLEVKKLVEEMKRVLELKHTADIGVS